MRPAPAESIGYTCSVQGRVGDASEVQGGGMRWWVGRERRESEMVQGARTCGATSRGRGRQPPVCSAHPDALVPGSSVMGGLLDAVRGLLGRPGSLAQAGLTNLAEAGLCSACLITMAEATHQPSASGCTISTPLLPSEAASASTSSSGSGCILLAEKALQVRGMREPTVSATCSAAAPPLRSPPCASLGPRASSVQYNIQLSCQHVTPLMPARSSRQSTARWRPCRPPPARRPPLGSPAPTGCAPAAR